MWKKLYSKLEVYTNFVIKRQTKIWVFEILTFQCVSMWCVPNCITTTTIAHECGKIPSFEHGGNFSIWEAYFKVVKFNLWKEIKKLCIYDIEVQELIKMSIMENDAWESTLWDVSFIICFLKMWQLQIMFHWRDSNLLCYPCRFQAF